VPGNICQALFDGALVEALLGDGGVGGGGGGGGALPGSKKSGFGFPRESQLVSFVEDINGSEVEWTMVGRCRLTRG